MVLLRRDLSRPELFQLLATFGLTLVVEDLVVLDLGPERSLGRARPALPALLISSARACRATTCS